MVGDGGDNQLCVVGAGTTASIEAINQGSTAGGNSGTGSPVNSDGDNGRFGLAPLLIVDGFSGLRLGVPEELYPPVVISATPAAGGSIPSGTQYYVITSSERRRRRDDREQRGLGGVLGLE